jgi:hypothetical protein
MAMAWISLGGSHPTRFYLLLSFLLLHVYMWGQRVVGVQPGEARAESYFFLEDSSATYFVSTFGNRVHDIKYVRGMSMLNGKHFAHTWNDQSHYLGVEVVQGNLELFYYSMSDASDSLFLWNTTMDSLNGWSDPQLLFSTGYSVKNRTPHLQCKVRGQTLVVF